MTAYARSLAPYAYAASVTSDEGITWTFDTNGPGPGGTYRVGRYISRRWWVQGPVAIASVSPAWDGLRNGSVLDMGSAAGQGLYNNGQLWTYDGALRATFPLTIPADAVHSLVSTIGRNAPAVGGAEQCLSAASVLHTVVDIPGADEFAPPYMGTKRTGFRWNRADLSALPNYSAPAQTFPDITGASSMASPWLHNVPNIGSDVAGVGAVIHPDGQMPPYPRDSALVAGNVAAAVLTNHARRGIYARQLVQTGIDLYGVHTGGPQEAFIALGGYGEGWKFPILFAGLLFGDSLMLSPTNLVSGKWGNVVRRFGEDGHTYSATNATYPGGRALWGANGAAMGYTRDGSHLYYANNDFRDPDGIAEVEPPSGFAGSSANTDLSNGAYRICCTSHTGVGVALAARKLGLMTAWNHAPFFDYIDRWIADGDQWGAVVHLYGSDLIQDLWGAHR